MLFDSLKPNAIRDAILASAEAAEAYAKRCRAAAAQLTGQAPVEKPVKPIKLRRRRGPTDMRGKPLTAPTQGAYGHLWSVAVALGRPFVGSDLVDAKASKWERRQADNALAKWHRKGWVTGPVWDAAGNGGHVIAFHEPVDATPETPVPTEADPHS